MTESKLDQLSYVVARVFNRTALGAWTLFALYLGYDGQYLISAAMIFIGIPIYFFLSDYFDAP